MAESWGVVQLVGHLTVNEDGVGSSPTAPANITFASPSPEFARGNWIFVPSPLQIASSARSKCVPAAQTVKNLANALEVARTVSLGAQTRICMRLTRAVCLAPPAGSSGLRAGTFETQIGVVPRPKWARSLHDRS